MWRSIDDVRTILEALDEDVVMDRMDFQFAKKK